MPACLCRRWKRLGFSSWVKKIPWRRAWQPTPVFLLGELHGQRSLDCCCPWREWGQVAKSWTWLKQLSLHACTVLICAKYHCCCTSRYFPFFLHVVPINHRQIPEELWCILRNPLHISTVVTCRHHRAEWMSHQPPDLNLEVYCLHLFLCAYSHGRK